MEDADTDRQAFIVRFWVETQEYNPDRRALFWRGRVTHVPSGLHHYFQDINEIIQFINPYLGKSEKRSAMQECIQCLRTLLKG